MGQEQELVPASALALDFAIYPRTRLSRDRLLEMRARHDAGKGLRPIVIDARSRQVIDGFHRVTMLLQGDTGAVVPAYLARYASNQSRWEDAIRRNSHAGTRLRLEDLRRCVRMAADLYPTPDADLAALLLVPVGHLQMLRDGRLEEPADVSSPIAATSWLAAHHADQLSRMLEADAIDFTDGATLRRFRRLAAAMLQVPALFHRSGVPVAASE